MLFIHSLIHFIWSVTEHHIKWACDIMSKTALRPV